MANLDQGLNSAIIKRINQLLEERNWKIYRMAVEAGLTPRSLNYIMRGERKQISIHTIKKICDACEITLGDFFANDTFPALPMD